MQHPRLHRGALLALVFFSCTDSPGHGGLALSNASPPASLLRLPRAGGAAIVYRLPRLQNTDWPSAGAFPPLKSALGADLDQRLVFAAGAGNQIVALDLENGKVRTYLAAVRNTIIGPDGVLYTVDDSNQVTQIVRRTPTRFTDRLPAQPRDLFGTLNDELLAIIPGNKNQLILLSPDQPVERFPLPTGQAAATMWGDLVAIAADTAVVLYTPHVEPPLRSIRVDGHARGVDFSASGHRLYVSREKDGLLEIDRYTDKVLRTIDLPGPAGELRSDPYGRWLLVHPAGVDSVWVIDLSSGSYQAAFPTDWASDLPVVAAGSILLLKQGDDVIAHDLTVAGMPETGRVNGGATDLWLPIAWTPERGTRLPVQADSTLPVASDSVQSSRVYLQVSSSQNPDWAGDLAQKLKEVGLPASVLNPHRDGDPYRVVLGPYESRETAEAAGRKLGRPFFIYQPDQQ
ncbi:MAG: SPOR domain-containing protein [Gemmatimonadota bacterium]